MRRAVAWAFVIALAFATNVPAYAQRDNTVPFVTEIMGAMDSIAKDSSFRAIEGTKSPMEVFHLAAVDANGRITDVQLEDFLRVFVKTLDDADTLTCAMVHGPSWQDAIEALGRQMSREDARGWARWYANLVTATVYHYPLRPTASRNQVVQWYIATAQQLSPSTRAQVLRGREPNASASDVCTMERTIYSTLLRLLTPRLVPVARAVVTRGF